MLTSQQLYGRHLPMTREGVVAAALTLKVDPPTIATVIAVEAGSDPFLSDGRPKILYEAHKFGAFTKHKYANITDAKGRAISARKWTKSLYGAAGAWQYQRLETAMKYDNPAALRAASWGGFQILGDNHRACGYGHVDDFVLDMADSGDKQLLAFIKFIQANGLADELQDKKWAAFAKQYNGPLYAQNQYDKKLAQTHSKMVTDWVLRFAKAVDPEALDPQGGEETVGVRVFSRAEIMAVQATLNASRVLISPIKADGWWGPKTSAAVKAYQKFFKLEANGELTEETLAHLDV
jgi:hypothetical protein